MIFRIMHGNDCIGRLEVSDFSRLIHIEREDDPTVLLVGLDLHADGSVTAGHWPDGEWIEEIETSGVW